MQTSKEAFENALLKQQNESLKDIIRQLRERNKTLEDGLLSLVPRLELCVQSSITLLEWTRTAVAGDSPS